MSIRDRLWLKLRGRKYRESFVASQAKRAVAFQIRAIRRKLNWTQQELADRAGVPQATISRAEDPSYGNLALNTLIAIANGFEAALLVKIVPFDQVEQLIEDIAREGGHVATFSEQDAARDAEGRPLSNSSVIDPSGPTVLTWSEAAQGGSGIAEPASWNALPPAEMLVWQTEAVH